MLLENLPVVLGFCANNYNSNFGGRIDRNNVFFLVKRSLKREKDDTRCASHTPVTAFTML